MNEITQETDMIRCHEAPEYRIISHIPESIRSLVQSHPGTFIAGGYLRDLVGNLYYYKNYVKKSPPDDIDIFFTDYDAAYRMFRTMDCAWKDGKLKLDEYYVRHDSLLDLIRTRENSHQFTYDDYGITANVKGTLYTEDEIHKINLCAFPQFFKRPQDIGRNFNYAINCICYDGKEVWVHDYLMHDLRKGDLTLIKICAPILHIEKMQKYIRYGFRITRSTAMQMVFKLRMGDYNE